MTFLRNPQVTALQAQATANWFLSDHLPDRFVADHPVWDRVEKIWCVLIVLAYPHLGPLGMVGEVRSNAEQEEVMAHTDFSSMMGSAQKLYIAHQNETEHSIS